MANGNDLNPYAYGDPETMGAVQSSQLMEPAVTNYFQRVLSGQIASEGLARLAGPAYVPGQSLAQMATDPARMEASTNVALGFGPGIMAGTKAATAGVDTLANAATMEVGGYSRKEIFNETGWFRGPGGQGPGVGSEWQFIVPDKDAQLRTENLEQTQLPGHYWGEDEDLPPDPERTLQHVPVSMGMDDIKLSDILQHDKLYDAYPWAKDITVRPMNEWQGRGGYTGGDVNTIWLSPQNEEGFKSSLIHEIQHAVQEREGFPRGGTASEFLPTGFRDQYNVAQNARDMLTHNIQVSGFDPETVAKEHGFWPNKEPVPEAQGHSEGLDPKLIQDYGNVSKQLGDLDEQRIAARNDYLSLGGEVQSRATEAMLRNQRWDLLPEESGEIAHDRWGNVSIEPYTPPSQQILRSELNRPPNWSGSGLPEPPPGWGYEPVDHDPFAGGQGQ